MTGFLQVETRDFAAAAATLSGHAGDPVQRAVLSLSDSLAGSGAMAGSDAGGRQWAAAYDRAARRALQAGVDVTNACYRLASLFGQSARNYEAAEAASSWRGRAPAPPPLPPDTELFVYAVPPSAAGGTGGGPPGWGLVQYAVGYAWPDGHQDRLHAAAAAWDACARQLADAAAWVCEVPWLFEHDGLPELADITAVCRGMHAHLTDLSGVQRGLADACTELAHHIDTAHASVISELEWLLGESALLQAGGVLVSIFSAGTAEGPTQAAQAARVAKAAATVRRLLETFLAAVRAVTARVTALVDRADRVVGELRGYADLRFSTAVVTHVRAMPAVTRSRELVAVNRLTGDLRELPRFTADARQLQAKFKHAADFGVRGNYSVANRGWYEKALHDFVGAPKTVRVWGTYRGNRVVLNYQVESRLVVVQRPDGQLLSAWRVDPQSMWNVRVRRSFGGG